MRTAVKQRERRQEPMPKVKSVGSPKPSQPMRPALTPEADEKQMISLAMDLVRQRLIDGTASSQETTHFLKLATAKYRLEKEILSEQKELISAKTEALQSAKRIEELYTNALDAMRRYGGHGEQNED